MTITALHHRVAEAMRGPVPVAVQDALQDVLATRVHAVADRRLRDVVAALRVDGTRPDLVREFEAVLREEAA